MMNNHARFVHRFAAPAMLACALAAGFADAAHAQAAARTVFVANNVSDSITTFTVDNAGVMMRIGVYPTGDSPQTIGLSPNGRFLAVGHGTSSEIDEELRIFEVNSDSSLTHRLTAMVPDSPLDLVWVTDEYLAVEDTGLSGPNYLQIYAWDATNNTLTFIDKENTGSFSAYLAKHPTEPIVYAESTGSTQAISGWLVNPDGTLTNIAWHFTGSYYPLELALTRDGSRLYSACGISGDRHRVLGFDVQMGGSIAPLAGSPFFSPGNSPAHVAVSSDNAYLFVGHGTDATAWSFAINPATGEITPTGHMFDVGLQGTLGDMQIVDDLLFITDESTAIDGITGIYCFRINADGSFTQLGAINDTMGVRPESIEVWGGAQTGVPATLTSATVFFGSHISGGLAEVLASDNTYLRGRSSFGFTSAEPNVVEIRIGAETAVQNPQSFDISIEGRLNTANGRNRVRFRNWSTTMFEQVHQYNMGTTESVESFPVVDAADYVLLTDGSISMSLRQSVVVVFSSAGFDSFTDWVEIRVR